MNHRTLTMTNLLNLTHTTRAVLPALRTAGANFTSSDGRRLPGQPNNCAQFVKANLRAESGKDRRAHAAETDRLVRRAG
jgi:hypothetical protein